MSEQDMPRYFPIDAGVSFDCDQSDLLTISWTPDSLSADFLLPSTPGRALRVRFNGATIVRLLDEMPLSTEQGTKNEGLVSRHFAYRVEGSTFAETQSEAWKFVYHPVCHYEFVTGSGCMDVLSKFEPAFEMVSSSEMTMSALGPKGEMAGMVRLSLLHPWKQTCHVHEYRP
jgi:hypothetical protein